MSWMNSRWAGKCRWCFKQHAAGDRVWYSKGVKGVLCVACVRKAENEPKTSEPIKSVNEVINKKPESKSPISHPEAIPTRDMNYIPPADGWNEKRTMYRHTYESYDHFLSVAESVGPMGEGGASRRNKSEDSWDLNAGWVGAKKLARQGWKEGMAKADALQAQLESLICPFILKDEVMYDVAGDFPDVGRACMGIPDSMGNMVTTEDHALNGHKKIIKITMDGFVSSGIDAERVALRGAAVMALVDALEKAGRAVEVTWIPCGTGDDAKKFFSEIPLKRSGEAMEEDRLAFALIHPAMFRRICFSAWEHEPEDVRNTFGIPEYYCHPGSAPIGDRGDIHLDSGSLHTGCWNDSASAFKWIKEQLEFQGVAMDMAEA